MCPTLDRSDEDTSIHPVSLDAVAQLRKQAYMQEVYMQKERQAFRQLTPQEQLRRLQQAMQDSILSQLSHTESCDSTVEEQCTDAQVPKVSAKRIVRWMCPIISQYSESQQELYEQLKIIFSEQMPDTPERLAYQSTPEYYAYQNLIRTFSERKKAGTLQVTFDDDGGRTIQYSAEERHILDQNHQHEDELHIQDSKHLMPFLQSKLDRIREIKIQ